jgi:MFS family permease
MADASLAELFRHRPFAYFWCARTATTSAYQMLAVAVGWQIYAITGEALDLGLVGLVQFVPIVAMSLVIGQVADHFDRRAVVRTCQVVKALCAATLAVGTASGWLGREAIFAILFVIGTARAFETPTLHALLPGIVPPKLLQRAIAASATANQTATIGGPALGGLLYLLGPTTVYVTCAAFFVIASILVSLLPSTPRPSERKPVNLTSLLAGFEYIRSRPILLGAISLDLFAVLLGGVTALLPIYARDILETGPWGLGLLRSAPAIGALAMSVVLAHYSVDGRIGRLLFASVAVFGVSIIVFALSTSFLLSFVALTIYGMADAVSVVIRISLVQTRTPPDMLGRVMAVNSLGTGSTSTLGDFESGLVAQWLGPVASALIGGIGAIVIALVWMRVFPGLRQATSLAENEGAGGRAG